jgi:hypothetical protein
MLIYCVYSLAIFLLSVILRKYILMLICSVLTYRGEKGIISHSIMDFQDWDAYSTKKPLLDTIPAAPPHGVYGSLYEANRPFVCKDDGRIALRSGALTIRSSRIPRDQPLR